MGLAAAQSLVPAFGLPSSTGGVSVSAGVKHFGQHLLDHVVPGTRNSYQPNLLSRRNLLLLSALLVSVKVFVIAAAAFAPVLPAFSAGITTESIVELTNSSRKELGLSLLSESSVLSKAAQAKADDMLAKGYFAHNSPEGKTPWDFIKSSGYKYFSAGENLAVNFNEAEALESAWMNSPGHRANIVKPTFEEVGIGIATGDYRGRTTTFVVQMFGTPQDQVVTLPETPTKVQKTEVPAPAPVIVPATPEVPSAPTVVKQPVKVVPVAVTPKPAAAVVAPAPAVVSLAPQPLSLGEPTAAVDENGMVHVVVPASLAAARVLVTYGQHATQLEPKAGGNWEGIVPLDELSLASGPVRALAFAMSGQSLAKNIVGFTPSATGEFSSSTGRGRVAGATVNVFGTSLDLSALERSFYLWFIAAMVAVIMLAIGIRRKIQHPTAIAHGAFAVTLATLLLVGM